MRRALLAVALLSTLSGVGHAQPVVANDEHLAGDRPEAWAMNYFAATTFLTAFGQVSALAPWQWTLAGELGSIPHLSDDQRRIGFDGQKLEDLNKSPVFGRLRLTVGLPYAFVGEMAYTPPLEINGARARNMFDLALGRRLLDHDPWTLSARAFGQIGSVRGDITCPASLAGVTDVTVNPYLCQAPSNDTFGVNYFGGDLTGSWNTGPLRWHTTFGIVRTDLDVQVDALTGTVHDRSHLTSSGYLRYVTLGGAFDFATQWSVAAEVLYVPLNVRRGPDAPRENDPLTSVRLSLRYRFN
ncbi:MAG TPA: hypothetical protein VLW55_12685 [Burkholderiaceae bacterium]|nr:hypothetical protein [Burkholderiaceae bacterium]